MEERTLVIIKPDVVKKQCLGEVIKRFEDKGFHITGMKMIQLTKDEAEAFYHVHRGKNFFNVNVEFITSSVCLPMVIEGKNVINKVRDFIGVTDPSEACKGTIRCDFGGSLPQNAVHASDGIETSKFEVNFFFPEFAW